MKRIYTRVMGWLEDELARQRAAEQAARSQPSARQPEVSREDFHARLHSLNFRFLKLLGVPDLLEDVQRDAWGGGDIISHAT